MSAHSCSQSGCGEATQHYVLFSDEPPQDRVPRPLCDRHAAIGVVLWPECGRVATVMSAYRPDSNSCNRASHERP